jgi:hypothetical protein
MKWSAILIIVFVTFCFAIDSELPLSREASLVEVYSPAEITIRATGMAKKDNEALIDARKVAVYYLLLLGTDPILNTQDAKDKFATIAEQFFEQTNISRYIAWESNKVVSVLKGNLPDGKSGYKLTKEFRVNKKLLTDELVAKGIISSNTAITDAVGLPQLMVIPETPRGQTPIQVFDTNPYAKQAAATIESFLTSRKYEVVVPRAAEQITDVVEATDEASGVGAVDISYRLALLMGSDVYIVFAGQVDNAQAKVNIKAYETTTARLLGVETGYSKVRPGVSAEALVEEAVNSTIENVLQRILNYWADDIKNGLQYKLIFKFNPDMSQTAIQTAQSDISDLIDEAFERVKENIVTDKTMDYLVWAKKEDFNRTSKIFRFFRDKLTGKNKVTQISINRKLLTIGIGE